MITYRARSLKYIVIFYFMFIIHVSANTLDYGLLIGSTAPPVSLKSLSSGGYIHSRDIVKEHPMVLVFFSSKNKLSLKMVSDLHQIKAGMKNTDIQYYLVNVFEDQDYLKSFVTNQVYTIPVIMDRYGTALKMFRSDFVPITVVINRGGKVSYYKQGYEDDEILNLIVHLRSIK